MKLSSLSSGMGTICRRERFSADGIFEEDEGNVISDRLVR
jgi:hypothetical protein